MRSATVGARAWTGLLMLGWFVGPASALGQSGSPGSTDAYRLLRYEEDYSHLCAGDEHPGVRGRDFWDPFKCVPLGSNRYLSLGGEARLQQEYDRPLVSGDTGGEDDVYLLQRYMLHADVVLGPHLRTFLQLKSGLAHGRSGGPMPFDEDRLDLHQAFLDVSAGPDRPLTLRLGRQEVALGNSRMVTVREGANVRLSFDGIRALVSLRDVQATAFWMKPVATRPGVLDDGWESGSDLAGVHLALPTLFAAGVSVDAYYLRHRRASAPFDQGIANEVRHTAGLRVSGSSPGFRFDVDGVVQRGSFGSAPLAAWAVAADLELAPGSRSLRARIGLRADLGSGDGSREDPALGTYHALYPRGPEVSQAPLVGPPNRLSVRPYLELSPHESLKLVAELSTFWRASVGDGIYGQGGAPLVESGASLARLAARELAVLGRWGMDRHLTVLVSASRFWAGPLLSLAAPSRAGVFFAAGRLEYRF